MHGAAGVLWSDPGRSRGAKPRALHLVQVRVRQLHRLFGELELEPVVLPEAIREDLPREPHGEVRRDAAPEVVTLAARDSIAQTHPAGLEYTRVAMSVLLFVEER